MHRRVTTGAPAGALSEEHGVVLVADKNLASEPLDLSVAFQAEVRIALNEELAIDGTMRGVADRAALAQGLVLEDKGARLLAVALRAGLVETRHGQAPGGFEN